MSFPRTQRIDQIYREIRANGAEPEQDSEPNWAVPENASKRERQALDEARCLDLLGRFLGR
jgi:hypothetical protein